MSCRDLVSDANVETKVYGLKTRVSGRQRWFTIGKHGAPWTPDTAAPCGGLLGDVACGGDPSDPRSKVKDLTLAELCAWGRLGAKR